MYVRTVGIAGRFKRKAGMDMKEVYFTITGMNHYLGSDFLKNVNFSQYYTMNQKA